MGRAARNINSQVILYADNLTDSIQNAVTETNRRRALQIEFNEKNNITPHSIEKAVFNLLPPELEKAFKNSSTGNISSSKDEPIKLSVKELEYLMWEAVEKLDFETAAKLRDKIAEIKNKR